MQNNQSPERRAEGDGSVLDVHSVFYTIQGEGPYSGQPAIFVRLAGCNLQCPGCDTEYTAKRFSTPYGELVQRVEATGMPGSCEVLPLVVVTGGEPFRQNISPFVCRLVQLGYRVQIETNGTYAPASGFPSQVKVVCSPKTGKVADGLLRHIAVYKYVLDAAAIDKDGLPTSVLNNHCAPARPPKHFGGQVYISPMDTGDEERNSLNRDVCVSSAMRFGYTLQLQIHKLLKLP